MNDHQQKQNNLITPGGDNEDFTTQPDDGAEEMYTAETITNETPQQNESDDEDLYHGQSVDVQVKGPAVTNGHLVKKMSTKGQTTKGQMSLMQELNSKLASRTHGYT